MAESYNSPEGSLEYINFINSENGKIEQTVLYSEVLARLSTNETFILDAGCGPGWLAGRLSHEFKNVFGCDHSAFLIDYAKKNNPKADFRVCDLTAERLPYDINYFSAIILNMMAHDLHDQKSAFANLYSILKPGGKLILTIANPYYAYPVGIWKRGIIGRLFFKKPHLIVRPYNFIKNDDRRFKWGKFLKPYFYPLSEQINALLETGFTLKYFKDIKAEADSKKFNLQYQLYRYPYILLLEFIKP